MNNQRYQRQIILPEIGEKGQAKLSQSSVVVIGAGGLGCPALQYLAAAGVGRIGIVDGDRVDISNLQRQVLYRTEDVGNPKAIAAKIQLEHLNPEIEINEYAIWLSPENATEIIGSYDLVIDATDNPTARYLINDACLLMGKPWVYAGVYRFEGQVTVFNWEGGPSYRCLFPEKEGAKAVSCNEAGVLGVVPGLLGLYQATEALKVLLGIGEPLSGKMMAIDVLTLQASYWKFKKQEQAIASILEGGKELLMAKAAEGWACSDEAVQELSWKEAFEIAEPSECHWIDVREEEELPKLPIPHLSFPLSKLEQQLEALPEGGKLLVFCQAGARSRKAVALLAKKAGKVAYSLRGGINQYR